MFIFFYQRAMHVSCIGRERIFTNRVLDVWNSLPESATFSSLDAFKRSG